MQNYFNHLKVKYSGRSQLEGEPRSASALSQRSILSPTGGFPQRSVLYHIAYNAGVNVAGRFPQPNRAPKQRIGNFAYPIRKQPANEVEPRGVANDDRASEQRRPLSALTGGSLPKWSRLHNAYNKQSSSKKYK